MTLTYVSERWAWSWSRDPVNFWALNVSFEMAKDSNFYLASMLPSKSWYDH